MGAKYRESRRTLRKCTLICRANQSTILLAETVGTVSDAVGYSGSRVRMEALPSAGGIVETASIPAVLFSPQWAFAKTSVEKATTGLPYELGGTKIGAWGNLYPVDAPKEKPPYDQQFPKEPRAAQHPCVKRTVLRFAQAFAQSEWALRYAIPIRTSSPAARWFASFSSFFFQIKKKDTVPPYQREIFYKKPCLLT